ncbi:lactosylceramide 1,3-N-acetyl-beta-D-glucosaminyltransferase A-like isoform X1 [Amphibalanus amphitrite]|uniref:lactosylceramide 1,3-N-acetyl-beta-D-glucosaminyltransferase A-like isoform X1 n=1 Tax=Amphibalanus amphitrite TaxID=1232801 RepID=UPI001C92281F|nr:lactosylceramide 1,3-N-acetyl-beta-D-glucosaminyltransferase A-like isoform X1 [Amphibalanus amphitrite]
MVNIISKRKRRISNRWMLSGIVALSLTIAGMTVVTSVIQQPAARHEAAANSSSWLQDAEEHVRLLARRANVTHPPHPRINRRPSIADDSSQLWPRDASYAADRLRRRKSAGSLNITKPPLYPNGTQLSNLSDFTFVINNDVCGYEKVDIVMVVTSDTRQPSWRAEVRAALPSAILEELRMRRVFLLAQLAPPADSRMYDHRMAAIQAENYAYADIVVGNFLDTYRNLTYKHLMGLRWASDYCPQARFILKMDHDTVVDVFRLTRRLEELPEGTVGSDALLGVTYAGSQPIRNPNSKWYVSELEYPESTYPYYMSGWLYLITPSAAARLVAASSNQPFFWVDDAFVTGVLRQHEAPDIQMLDFETLWLYIDEDGKGYSPMTMYLACVYECVSDEQASVSQCPVMIGPVWMNPVVMRLFYGHAQHCHTHGCALRKRIPVSCANGWEGYERRNMPEKLSDIGDVTDATNR